jgi:hypothetical protein
MGINRNRCERAGVFDMPNVLHVPRSNVITDVPFRLIHGFAELRSCDQISVSCPAHMPIPESG